VVIDGIAPYRWTGSNAQARWLSDAEKWLHDFGVEKETLVCDKIVHTAVVGTYAYVVILATLSLALNGGKVEVGKESLRSRSKTTSGRWGHRLGAA
jgi:hypothetical protein